MEQHYGVFDVPAKTRQVVDHHYDDTKLGKPLYLMIPGGLVALASLSLIVLIGYFAWISGTLPQNEATMLIALLSPLYIGGVFLFSYAYELYDFVKALRLTAIIVFLTVASVVIVAALAVAVGAMTEQGSGSSDSRRSRSSTRNGAGGGMSEGGWMPWPIFWGGLGGFGAPTPTVTREIVREVPAEPPKPQPVRCPYCGSSYVPENSHFECPNCGAVTPNEVLQPDRVQDGKNQ